MQSRSSLQFFVAIAANFLRYGRDMQVIKVVKQLSFDTLQLSFVVNIDVRCSKWLNNFMLKQKSIKWPASHVAWCRPQQPRTFSET